MLDLIRMLSVVFQEGRPFSAEDVLQAAADLPSLARQLECRIGRQPEGIAPAALSGPLAEALRCACEGRMLVALPGGLYCVVPYEAAA